ncbi:MAG: hypothetical protein IJT36_02450 [Alphaproteobacteria bacterium]|nr:hypothetical protein [Alphaproteobacteria bacterium]
MDVTNGRFVENVWLVVKRQLFAKIKRMKYRYYTLEYYPSKMKIRNKYSLKKTKYLPEEMIDYPPPWVLLQNDLNDDCMVISIINTNNFYQKIVKK